VLRAEVNSQFAIRDSQFDLLVVGAGPGGSTAARVAAAEGLRVLLVEKRPVVGLPVQCAEYVPAQIVAYVSLPERCIAQRIRTLRTRLPDGESVETPAAGYVLDRALFDKSLAVAACRAGAEVWTATRAVEQTERGVLIRQGSRTTEVECRVVIGADGPRSTVGRWIGQTNTEFIDGLQVEVVLPTPQASTQVYFDPTYQGGYGWLFPKGETANVGVGVSRRMGGDPRQALDHLLEHLGIASGAIVGRTGGPVPSGGTVAHLRVGNVLLVGDAAGHTHPVTCSSWATPPVTPIPSPARVSFPPSSAARWPGRRLRRRSRAAISRPWTSMIESGRPLWEGHCVTH
jgi:geranylgeranyl reductase family protein